MSSRKYLIHLNVWKADKNKIYSLNDQYTHINSYWRTKSPKYYSGSPKELFTQSTSRQNLTGKTNKKHVLKIRPLNKKKSKGRERHKIRFVFLIKYLYFQYIFFFHKTAYITADIEQKPKLGVIYLYCSWSSGRERSTNKYL